ncbi:MAG: Rieske 2Fe-2S domain-containing protein [Imperialibacter sp.]|uniref:QcrA and Rieske domain-containing protein n=1 Tax=Imperialibacter sp. TaxID=2038411 RepID=UPI0032ECCB37
MKIKEVGLEMTRGEFVKSLGISVGAIMATWCIGGLTSCMNADMPAPGDGGVDFTIDLEASENKALLTNGGWLIKNSVVIARTNSGDYVAVTQVCSHEGRKQVAYRASKNDFYCNAHGATYSISGKGTNSAGSRGLTRYTTQLDKNSLRVFG